MGTRMEVLVERRGGVYRLTVRSKPVKGRKRILAEAHGVKRVDLKDEAKRLLELVDAPASTA